MSRFDLSVLMPVYNEIKSIAEILNIVKDTLPGISKEIIIVDDASKDGTRDWLEETFGSPILEGKIKQLGAVNLEGKAFGSDSAVKVIFHKKNQGKGAAIQTAMRASTGAILVIQDADLEYDPSDWIPMYDLVGKRKIADVVYGSRFYGQPHRSLYYHHYVANRLISMMFNVLYNQTLSDIETCYKMFTREVLNSLNISATDFGVEVQISAQFALHRRWRIYELGIHYYGRTYDEGKKIGWKDGAKALWYLAKYRIRPGN
jgi:glycosyltransferase involved in cell wall biosynthesis